MTLTSLTVTCLHLFFIVQIKTKKELLNNKYLIVISLDKLINYIRREGVLPSSHINIILLQISLILNAFLK